MAGCLLCQIFIYISTPKGLKTTTLHHQNHRSKKKMESSSSADQREEEEEEEERHPLLHSPCHFFEQLITSCLKCLGLDHHFSSSSSAAADDGKTKADHHQQCPPQQTEMEMKLGEDVVVVATGTARSTRALGVKRPIGTGSGPQINRASS
nr:PREDICTED: uncharacterized protein LOC105352013 [Fragaria vesca subsp. vesca]